MLFVEGQEGQEGQYINKTTFYTTPLVVKKLKKFLPCFFRKQHLIIGV